MVNDLILGLLIGAVLAAVVFNLLKKKREGDLSSVLDQKFDQKIPLLASTLKQQLEAEKQDIQTDLKNKKDAIETAIKRLYDELKHSNKKVEDAERERIGSFRELKKELEQQKTITEQLSVTTDGLRRVLSNNQLRGQFGEQVAEDLLKMAGFVKGVDYHLNKGLKESPGRPDLTIFLPDKTKINVDAKFPFANLQKAVDTQDAPTRREHLKAFEGDIREKIKQVATRDYINPEENTVDFVIMFIPNEMVFSYIYDKMHDVWSGAMKQKVVFAGPFSFTAILRMVRQSYETFRYQKNVQRIITYIKTFETEFKKYNLEFEKIGDRISSLSNQYDLVNTTRTKQLMRTVDRISLEEASTKNPLFSETPEEGNKGES